MTQYIKPDNISGLNSGHALYSKLQYALEYGQLDKELVNDTALTISNAPVQSDSDIGSSRKFTDASSVTETISISSDITVVIVCRPYGDRLYSGDGLRFLDYDAGGNKVIANYSGFGSAGFEVLYRGGYGTERNYKAGEVATDLIFNSGFTVAIDLADTETMSAAYNGSMVATTNTNTSGALSGAVNVALMTSAATQDDFNVGVVYVFDKLSDAEKESITSAPWGLLAVEASITSVDTDNTINPSQTDVAIQLANAPASVTTLHEIKVGGTVSGETITGGEAMGNIRWNSGTPLFDVPSGATLGTGLAIHVRYTE